MKEAQLTETEQGLVPTDEGWYVLNTRDAVWYDSAEFGRYARWEGKGEARFPEVGINIAVMQPGQPACMYHGEDAQEDFLVLAGEGILIIEGEERPLQAWDFVHCPPWAKHVIVAAGSEPFVVIAVGARNGRTGLLLTEMSSKATPFVSGIINQTYNNWQTIITVKKIKMGVPPNLPAK